jgi:deoxyribodipyrimidine photo-lyase
VPELAALDNVSIHAPGALRPVEYPPPLVDHASERIEALRRYEVARAGSR